MQEIYSTAPVLEKWCQMYGGLRLPQSNINKYLNKCLDKWINRPSNAPWKIMKKIMSEWKWIDMWHTCIFLLLFAPVFIYFGINSTIYLPSSILCFIVQFVWNLWFHMCFFFSVFPLQEIGNTIFCNLF